MADDNNDSDLENFLGNDDSQENFCGTRSAVVGILRNKGLLLNGLYRTSCDYLIRLEEFDEETADLEVEKDNTRGMIENLRERAEVLFDQLDYVFGSLIDDGEDGPNDGK